MIRSSVRGLVRDDAEWPLAEARVAVTPLSPTMEVPDIAAVTDPRGRYELDDLGEGRYRVTVTLDGFHPAAAETFVGAEAAARVDFHLTRVSRKRTALRSHAGSPDAGNPHEQISNYMTGDGGEDVVEEID